MSNRVRLGAAVLLVSLVALARSSTAQLGDTFTNWIDHPAIAYQTRHATDPVARLNQALQEGRAQLKFDGPSGYLRSTVDALHIPVESQVALFSQDSLQRQIINSLNPRTILFNDRVAVAFVRGGFIEIAAQDPRQGIVFYALDNDAPVAKPQFTRRFDCLGCHYSYSTVGVPGMLDQGNGRVRVDHSVPIEQRWGGWYVTGQANALHHLGNRVVSPVAQTAGSASSTWPSLDIKLNTAGYLSSHSDIVALLVFNHQMRAMNLLGRIGWEATIADFMKRPDAPLFALPKGVADDAPIALDAAAREVVDYLLFVDEAPLASPVRGASGFAERFEAEAPRDRQGRSLRQLDLDTRLLKYPCSYMIYTETFDALPGDARRAIYQRMWRVLSGEEKDPRYRRLSAKDRRAVIEIVRDTKADLPSYWQ